MVDDACTGRTEAERVQTIGRTGGRGPRRTNKRCRVERSLLWEITGSLAATGNDLRVGKQLLFSKPKIVIKHTVFNRAHTKDSRPTSSIQR